jgi:hypothetical protein
MGEEEFLTGEIGEEGAGQARQDGPRAHAYELQGEDGCGDRCTEDGGKAGGHAAEEQGATFGRVVPMIEGPMDAGRGSAGALMA